MERLTDRVAVITGGGSGIGLATARRFTAEAGTLTLGRPTALTGIPLGATTVSGTPKKARKYNEGASSSMVSATPGTLSRPHPQHVASGRLRPLSSSRPAAPGGRRAGLRG